MVPELNDLKPYKLYAKLVVGSTNPFVITSYIFALDDQAFADRAQELGLDLKDWFVFECNRKYVNKSVIG